MNGKHADPGHGDGGFIAALSMAIAMAVAGCNRADVDDTIATPAPASQGESAAPATPPAAVPGDGVAAQFTMMDKDADGSIDPDEHAAGAAGMFAKMDADADGIVTSAEMDAGQAALDGDTRMSSADKIKAIDTDADGRLSRDEHAAGSRSMFGAMDSDGDASLSREELQAGHDRMMGGPPPGAGR